jgi:hypothetical protein
MKNSCLRLWLAVLTCALVGSCDVINPDEILPTTLHLEPFNFIVDPGQGSSNNKISEVWVTANGNVLGAFTPPVDIQYLEEGPVQFRFYPGIRNNGIANDARPYIFFTSDSASVVATPGSEHTVTPVTRYVDDAVFSFICDFESGNPFTSNRDTVPSSRMELTQEEVFEGEFAGLITMTPEANFINVTHGITLTDLPTDGVRPTYLEFRYQSEIEFSIGIVGGNLSGEEFENFFYLVKPSAEWNQLYIELTDILELSGFTTYKIGFKALYLTTVGDTSQNIFLDNIKVVHR